MCKTRVNKSRYLCGRHGVLGQLLRVHDEIQAAHGGRHLLKQLHQLSRTQQQALPARLRRRIGAGRHIEDVTRRAVAAGRRPADGQAKALRLQVTAFSLLDHGPFHRLTSRQPSAPEAGMC